MAYRRSKTSDYVDFCRNYPLADEQLVERSSQPSGDLCNECRSKRRAGNCRS